MKDILSAFIRMLPTDGNNQTFIYRTLDRYFSERYHLYIEQPDNFRIEYKSPGKGKINKITVSGVCLDTIYQNMPTFEDLYKEPLKFEILGGSNIAVLTIKTFISKFLEHFGFDLDEFLAFAFKKIQKDNVENLIIDLRWNDGGDLGSELLAYLIDKPIRFFKRIDTPRTRYSFLEHTDKGVFFNSFHTTLWEKARDNTGRYLLSGDWSRFIEPKSTLFKGNVYILINGMSVSGTSDIAVVTHYYKRAIFIGEETGGAYYGNNAGDYLKLTLPNTKIRVKIPIRRYLMAVSDYPYPDRGVIPDFEIKPTIEDILNQIDTELEYTIKLIRTK